jgi:hypothetical protein
MPKDIPSFLRLVVDLQLFRVDPAARLAIPEDREQPERHRCESECKYEEPDCPGYEGPTSWPRDRSQ